MSLSHTFSSTVSPFSQWTSGALTSVSRSVEPPITSICRTSTLSRSQLPMRVSDFSGDFQMTLWRQVREKQMSGPEPSTESHALPSGRRSVSSISLTWR